VVLLAGLPGDVESESDYKGQLQTWLEIVETSGQVQALFVLCDNPESVTPSAKIKTKVLKASRESFLGLVSNLAGATNPLVVVAWGHGGKQGGNPVFHVRGPRLMPADFKSVSEKVEGRESRWILFFRGSGGFASQLAGPGRQILSSEKDTMFSSDPIGMPLLLKLARADSARSFSALGEEFGRATAAWYNERHLARTEEPTLWVANEKPRLLSASDAERSEEAASSATGSSSGETRRQDVGAPGSGETRRQDAGAPGSAPAALALPAAWQSIQRVEPGKYPEADGVILRRRVSYTLGSSPAIASERDEFIQVLTPEGKRFGDFDIEYSPPFEDISFLDCEVLKPDGKLERLDPDAIREGRESALGDYQAGHRKFFSLPGVVPGAVLHVRYRTQWKQFPMPHVSLEIPIGEESPALESSIEVSVPKESAFHYEFDHIAAPDPEVKQSSYGTTYAWRLEHVPPHEREILAAPHDQPRLLLSTFADWPQFAEWYGRISKLTDAVTPEISAKAAELTREAGGDRAKVLAVYNFVTGLRYVAVPLGVNSFRPHAAANVLQNQFGDCKDKANLFNTLLHCLKIDAHLVLVPRFRQARDGLPGLAFNHAISRVTLGTQTLWVDTTDDTCRFGLLPPGDPGRKVLVLDGQAAGLTQLPSPEPSDHQLKLHGEINCSTTVPVVGQASRPRPGVGASERESVERGAWTDAPTLARSDARTLPRSDAGETPGPLPASLSVIATGFLDYELRATARETREHRASLPLLAARFRPAVGSFALEKQTATAVSRLDENFNWQADGASVGIASASSGSLTLRCPFWIPKEWDLALHRRKSALFLNQGYPLTLEEEFEFALPPGAQPGPLPGVSENKSQPLRWSIEWKKSGEDKLTAIFRAELARGDLSLAETPALQRQLGELLAVLESGASIEIRNPKSETRKKAEIRRPKAEPALASGFGFRPSAFFRISDFGFGPSAPHLDPTQIKP
jgi:hypothetical protein